MNVNVAWAYDPTVLPKVKEFHVYQVDPTTHAPTSSATVTAVVPTDTAPLAVPVSGYGQQTLGVTAFDGAQEGNFTYMNVYVKLPGPTAFHIVG